MSFIEDSTHSVNSIYQCLRKKNTLPAVEEHISYSYQPVRQLKGALNHLIMRISVGDKDDATQA